MIHDFELAKQIAKELVEITKDEDYDADFRARLRAELLEIKREAERGILLWSQYTQTKGVTMQDKPYVPNDGTGYALPNKFHLKGDKKPCLTGTVQVHKCIYKVAIWAPKKGKRGYFIKFEAPEEAGMDQRPPAEQAETLPF